MQFKAADEDQSETLKFQLDILRDDMKLQHVQDKLTF